MSIASYAPSATRGPYPERSDETLGALDFTLTKLLSALSFRFVRHASRPGVLASRVDGFANLYDHLSDEDILQAARTLRGCLLRDGFQFALVAQCLALVSEVVYRKLTVRPYPVQLVGAHELLRGRFIEMETGEGKTLTGCLAAATAALAGKPVHVITVNDYLAARDAEHLRPIYEALGLTVGVIQHGDDAEARRKAYSCDVTYVVNKELAFDYLRDRLALGARRSYAETTIGRLVTDRSPPFLLRGLWFAIIDEADSILIDEARTPLIISGMPSENDDVSYYRTAIDLVRGLEVNEHFVPLPRERRVKITDAGQQKLKDLTAGMPGLWQARKARNELAHQALAALHLYQRDQHYVVLEGKVQIVDEFTGRIAEGRSWQHGLHQMIEVKEDCELTARQLTQAAITYQRFFRRYLRLSGMSGTLSEVASELSAVYATPVKRIPTHRPSRRTAKGLRIFANTGQKWTAVVNSVIRHQRQQRPLLIGTRSIETSELLSKSLSNRGIEHVVLNAHNDREEAGIVAKAGNPGHVTVATNMAGRGTDIKLGEGVADRGGLHVILTELHESARIDRQLVGRGGRQGDPGSFETIASLEDELIAQFAPRTRAIIGQSRLSRRAALASPLAKVVRWHVQTAAERLSYRIRRQTMRLQTQQDKALAFAHPE